MVGGFLRIFFRSWFDAKLLEVAGSLVEGVHQLAVGPRANASKIAISPQSPLSFGT